MYIVNKATNQAVALAVLNSQESSRISLALKHSYSFSDFNHSKANELLGQKGLTVVMIGSSGLLGKPATGASDVTVRRYCQRLGRACVQQDDRVVTKASLKSRENTHICH